MMKLYVCMDDGVAVKAVATESEAADWMLKKILEDVTEEEFVDLYNGYVDVVDEIGCVECASPAVIQFCIAPDFALWCEEIEFDEVQTMLVPKYDPMDDLPFGAPEQKRSWAGKRIRKL